MPQLSAISRISVFFSAFTIASVSGIAGSLCDASDWTRFRGPNGTGRSQDAGVPIEINETENLLWKVELPGRGNSSPIAAGGRIYLQTASANGSDRLLLCLDLKDGHTLWDRTEQGGMGVTHLKNTLASCTGAVAGDRVYMPFWDGKNLTVSAYEIDGQHLWTRDLGKFVSQHGAGHSPVVVGEHVIIVNDQDGLAEVVALEAKTGAVAWKKPREAYRASYSTPIIIERAGHGPEIVIASTGGIAGYDPATGAESWKWTWTSNKQQLRTVASPIICNDHLLFSGGNGPGARHAVAVALNGKDDAPQFAWETLKDFPYVPCLLSRDENVYFINDSGIAGCFDAVTGKRRWLERLPGGDVTASPVMVEDRIYAFSENGTAFVFRANSKFELLSSGRLDEGVKASPAVADGRLLVRGEKSLYCFGTTSSGK
jgi:outer membrane protein assembly factor BamB